MRFEAGSGHRPELIGMPITSMRLSRSTEDMEEHPE